MEKSPPPEISPRMWFYASSVVYLLTHLLFLEDYPIYFLFDEAMQSILAGEFIDQGFFGYAGQWLPTFFPSGGDWSIATTVYLHTPVVALFGNSIIASRALSALFASLAAVACYWILRDGIKSKLAWVGVLFLSVTPIWFIHSRTSLVVAPMVAFYALFVAAYQRYIEGDKKFLFVAVASAGAAYYCYSPAQLIIPATLIALFFSNLAFHLKNWRWTLLGISLIAVVLTPALLFRLAHPELLEQQLSRLTGVLTGDAPLGEKAAFVASNYLGTLNPFFWFWSNEENPRHQMAPYYNISSWMFPFFIVGCLVALYRIKSSAYRTILLTLLIAPLSTAVAGVSAVRAQAYVFPAVVISVIGFSSLVRTLNLLRLPFFPPATFICLASVNFLLLYDTLVAGPTWSRDYGLYGMQWGASQLFNQEIPKFLAANPASRFRISPNWANGGDIFSRFFKAGPNIEIATIENTLRRKDPELSQFIYISPAAEFEEAVRSGIFKNPIVHHILNYPDGLPGFYFAQWEYSASADRKLQALALERLILKESEAIIGGQPATVKHTISDIGTTQHLFDSDPKTLLRGASLNPFLIDIQFSSARVINGLSIDCGDPQYTATLVVTDNDGKSHTFVASSQVERKRGIAHLSFPPLEADRAAIEIKNTAFAVNDKDYSLPIVNIHVYSVDFNFLGQSP